MRPRLYDLAYVVFWPLREAGAVEPTADQWRWLAACCASYAAASSDLLAPSDWNAFIWMIAMLPVLGIAVAPDEDEVAAEVRAFGRGLAQRVVAGP